ncbi:hypothetical protein B1813_17025 [Saccharomonospora piscinae]|uniref:Uncharacterized protein n=1 Tax=Saccharomonospora piscinae TaxID=687388 RepID=A0A1V9A2C3_SACPI|nr:hypothetical protein [Saccharomonospora piscinae]OQO91180.1 hypothetical protein B1813_17025 [Saccharomonospora piscinae]
MSEPSHLPPPPFPPAAPPTPKPRRGVPLVFGLVAGVLVGAGGIGLTWWLTTPSDGGGADADARAACEIADRTSTVDVREDSAANLHRWGAVVSLAAAAAEPGEKYDSLYEALNKPLLIFRQQYDTDSPEYAEAMQAAREACAAL